MTFEPPSNRPDPPSWAAPIAAGAFFSLVYQGGLQLMAAASEQLACAAVCCCALGFVPLGFVPASIAMRRDPALTAGQGFAVSFIATGLGHAILAAIVVVQGPQPGQVDEFRRLLEEGRDPQGGLTQQQIDAAVELFGELLPYLPIVGAALMALLSGLVGLATVALLRARGQPPPPPGP